MSCENSGFSLFGKTVLHVLTRPACLLFYWLSWHHLCDLCWYGRLYRNVPVLTICFLWWLCAIGYGFWLWSRYKKGRCPLIFHEMLHPQKGLVLSAGTEMTESAGGAEGASGAGGENIRVISADSIKWYIKKRHFCQFFLKNKEVLLLDLREITGEKRDFLNLKLSAVGFPGKGMWRAAAGIFLAVITLRGAGQVAESAIPFRGKLAWFLDDLMSVKTCTLEHDNVYDWGIEGLLEDVREKVDLPQTLCFSDKYELRFAPDGRILIFGVMLYGFDDEKNFADSYLISYNGERSPKITIRLHGAYSALYDPDRSLELLVDAVSRTPLQEIVSKWEGEDCFEILYYGDHQWYGISVFCPENAKQIPFHYFYPKQE